ncbi:MAG: BTAD domain-containing putative transcriptional regulator [Thermodesulfobacteriota bacterium]
MNKTFPIPEVREAVPRSRLFSILDRNRDKKAVFITGQAAQGKSTFAASYLTISSEPTLWFHLTEKESDPAAFFHLVCPPVCRVLGRPETLERIRAFTSTLAATEDVAIYTDTMRELFAACGVKLNIVLDDLDSLDKGAHTLKVIQELASSLTGDIRFFFLSRVMPGFEIHKLKLENKMICIDNADLAFTFDETARFFRERNQGWISQEHLQRVHAITEGWIGGIVLVSEAIRQKSDLSWLSELIRGDVVDYFSREVYPQLEKEVKEFLIKISVFDEIDPETAERFTGNAGAGKILETLEKRNLFVHRVLEGKKGLTFRINKLFRDFLQRKLEVKQGGQAIKSLCHDAGVSLEETGEIEKSIRFFLRAGAWKKAGKAVAGLGTDFLIQGRVKDLAAWIEAMPESVVWKDPWLIFYLTMTRRIKGGSRNLEDFQIALELFRERNDVRGILLCTAYMIEAVVFLKSSPDLIETWIEQGKAVLESVNNRPIFTWARAVLWQQIGFGYIAGKGEVPRGISACKNAYILGSKIRNAEIQLNASIVIILGHVYTGNLHDAEKLLDDIKNLAHDGIHPEYRTLKNLVNIDLALKKGAFETAEYYLDISQKDIETFGMIFLYPGFIEAKAMHRVYTGRFREALELADHLSDFSILSGNSFYQGNAHRVRAVAFYHSGEMEKAAHEADQAVALFDRNHNRDLHYYTAMLIQGLVLTHIGETGRAQQALEKAFSGFEAMNIDLLTTETSAALGILYQENGDMEKAGTVLPDAVSKIFGKGYTRFVVTSPDDFTKIMVFAACWDLEDGLDEQVIAALVSNGDIAGTRTRIRELMERAGGERFKSVYRLTMPRLRIETLGEFRVLVDGKELDSGRWDGHKPKLLLKSIIRHHGHDVPKEMIIEDIWPGSSAKAGEKNFKINLHRLRKALEQDLEENAGFSYIHLESGVVSLDPVLVSVDINEFYDFCRKGHEYYRREMPEQALLNYEKACELYKGDFLEEEPYLDWPAGKRNSLRDEYIYVLMKKAEINEEINRIPLAVRDLKKVIETNPLEESAYQNLMILYADSGETNAALKVFEQCKHTIEQELGAEPDQQTIRLYREISARRN